MPVCFIAGVIHPELQGAIFQGAEMGTENGLSHIKRLEKLAFKRMELENLSEEEALDVILSDPQAPALVHSYPEEDLFFLMHRIGPDDFLPVLAMATDRQWHFILDQEVWQKDLPDYGAVNIWFLKFLVAAPERFVRFMVEEEGDLMDAWLFRNLEVRIREHDEDPSDFPDGFMTMDDVLYFRLRPLPEELEEKPEVSEARGEALELFMKKLADFSHPFFFRILQEMAWSIPAELEEAALRWRQSRMTEKGFVPREEALGLFQPLREGELEKKGKKVSPKVEPDLLFAMIPEHGKRMTQMEEELVPVFAGENLDSGELQLELAHLCNAFLSAKGEILRSREAMDALGRMMMGYLRVGISRITGKSDPGSDLSALVFKTYRMEMIFRAGFGPVVQLKWQADRWKDRAWFKKNGLPLSFWDEEGMGILGGLFLHIPMRYDAGAKTGRFYRPFARNDEIRQAGEKLDQIIALDGLFALLGLLSIDAMGRPLTWKNLLLTLWASDTLEGQFVSSLVPVHMERFRSFFEGFLAERENSLSGNGKAFMEWLSRRTSLEVSLLEKRIGTGIAGLFAEVLEEFSGLDGDKLDQRYIRLFLLRPA